MQPQRRPSDRPTGELRHRPLLAGGGPGRVQPRRLDLRPGLTAHLAVARAGRARLRQRRGALAPHTPRLGLRGPLPLGRLAARAPWKAAPSGQACRPSGPARTAGCGAAHRTRWTAGAGEDPRSRGRYNSRIIWTSTAAASTWDRQHAGTRAGSLTPSRPRWSAWITDRPQNTHGDPHPRTARRRRCGC